MALRRPYRSVTAAEAAALLEGGAILVDVREPYEWRAGHAPRARHIPLGALPHRMRELPERRMLVTVCHSGMRSARAAALLARSGHDVVNLRGGMMAWRRAGLPLVTPSGRR
ncbi:MAG TPA: rhodanese-like domain-containing protein [Dehalococcoidia bacterium]|nr:rhodanese-like domain-containing protein [Dehalococcoidia bacterium]